MQVCVTIATLKLLLLLHRMPPIEAFSGDAPGLVASPRISFSHDLLQSDAVPRIPTTSSSPSLDFDFRVRRDLESSSADELFSDGKILPIQINRRFSDPRVRSPLPHPTAPVLPGPQLPPKKLRSFGSSESKTNTPESNELVRSSFWRFNRSSSSNSGGRGFCSLPLLSTSISSGGKRSSSTNNQKDVLESSSWQRRSRSAASTANICSSSRSPPLKKSNSHNLYSNNRTNFNPVLNLPPANLFGLASILACGKDRRKKKYY